MLQPGTRAPEFTLTDHEGRERSLVGLLGNGPLILYFYPADFTPGCTAEACAFRDLHTDILRAGLRVAGISPQPPDTHRRFREKHALPFILLSDGAKSVIKRYDVDGPFGFGVRRASFLIERGGLIQAAVLADFRISRHEEFVRQAIALRNAQARTQ